MDLREYLLSAPETGIIRPADCPEWDKKNAEGNVVEKCELDIREMDILTRATWRRLSWVPALPAVEGKEPEMKWDQGRANATLVTLCTYYRTGDNAGQRVFQDDDVEHLLKLPGRHEDVIRRLVDLANEVNFLEAKVAEVAAKNSKSTRKSGTSSK